MTKNKSPPSPTASEAVEEKALERASKRAQVWRGQIIHQPTKSELRGNIVFEDDLDKERYEEIHQIPIVSGKSVHDLKTLYIKINILKLIYAIS